MAIHEWWAGDAAERFWMETTNRTDVGTNLLAPQVDERGNQENPGYFLVTYVEDGDVATLGEVTALVEAITPRYRAAVLLAAWCSLRSITTSDR